MGAHPGQEAFPDKLIHLPLTSLIGFDNRRLIRALSIPDGLAKSKVDFPRFQDLATRQLQAADVWKGQILTLESPEYPDVLKKHSKVAPPVLHARGDLSALSRPHVAVVGTRSPSAVGRQNAFQLSRELTADGIVVVSGLAIGVDAAAHAGALEGGGQTIAVLGQGVDRVYPPQNAGLFPRIVKHGLLVSEFPFGTPTSGENLRRRNKVIVGLSSAVVVVECPLRSGAMIAARSAAEMNVPLIAVIAGTEATEQDEGTRWLVSKGLAQPLASISLSELKEAASGWKPAESGEKEFDEVWPKKRQSPQKTPPGLGKTGGSACSVDAAASHGRQEAQLPLLSPPVIKGDVVQHSKFGEGTVREVLPNGTDWAVCISFDGKQVKTILWGLGLLKRT